MCLPQTSSGGVDSFVTGLVTLEADIVNDAGVF
jgi:hypothetical protein